MGLIHVTFYRWIFVERFAGGGCASRRQVRPRLLLTGGRESGGTRPAHISHRNGGEFCHDEGSGRHTISNGQIKPESHAAIDGELIPSCQWRGGRAGWQGAAPPPLPTSV